MTKTDMNRIDCNLSHGTGDARVALEVRGGDLVLATNGGPMRVDATGGMNAPECSLAAACDALGCSSAELRAAVVEAYPPAAGWDWASDAPSSIPEIAARLAADHAASPEVRAAGGCAAEDADDFEGTVLRVALRKAGRSDDADSVRALKAALRAELARLAGA